jgi:serine/threonine-protein kinase
LTDPTGLQGERYERLSVLGSGGQGVVYRAFDRWTQREVAIKVMKSEAVRQPHMAERLNREQQALSALKGTAAVEVLDIYRGHDGELCMVMEFLQGTNLDAHLVTLEDKNERMELARVAEIFAPIVDTLEVAHKAGIVHRDLKPANVFLLEDGGVRLLDFGMARLKKAAPLTAAGTVMGSPSYMAPEAWGGRSELVDHRADVYSLGVILFRVLAGDLPFTGLSLYEKMLGSTKAQRPSLYAKRPDLPRDADEWVALALAIDRDQRFSNVRALWNAFLTTFDIEPPKRGKRGPSLLAKAAGKVKALAGIADSARSADPQPSDPALSATEPSFVTQALARSVARESEPISVFAAPVSQDERTIELAEKTLELPKPSARGAGKSREKSLDIPIVEGTVELSGADLFVEDTLPDPRALADTLPDGTRAAAVARAKRASEKSGGSSETSSSASGAATSSKRRRKGRKKNASSRKRRR